MHNIVCSPSKILSHQRSKCNLFVCFRVRSSSSGSKTPSRRLRLTITGRSTPRSDPSPSAPAPSGAAGGSGEHDDVNARFFLSRFYVVRITHRHRPFHRLHTHRARTHRSLHRAQSHACVITTARYMRLFLHLPVRVRVQLRYLCVEDFAFYAGPIAHK